MRADSWLKAERAGDWQLPPAFNEPASLLFVVPLTSREFATIQQSGLMPRVLDELLSSNFLV